MEDVMLTSTWDFVLITYADRNAMSYFKWWRIYSYW